MKSRERQHGHMKVEANVNGRDFVCGDIHGCYDLLMESLHKVSFNPECDRLFALGDIIDRGPDSLKCLRLVREKWFYSLLGNHEQMMLNFMIEQHGRDYWYRWGGLWHSHLATPQDKQEVTSLCYGHAATLPHSITLGDGSGGTIGLVHAEPPENWHYAQSDDIDFQSMIWGRDRILNSNPKPVLNIAYVLVGHSTDNHIRQRANVFYLDTGAGYPQGFLTLVEIRKDLREKLQRDQ